MVKGSVLMALLALAAGAQNADIEAVRKMARELERALLAADTATLEKILTDDFLRRPPGARDTNKREYLAQLSSGQLKYLAFQNVSEKFRSYPNTVLVDDVTDIRARGPQGAEIRMRLKLTWTWVKLEGQWRLAGVQGSQDPGQ